MSKLHLDFLEVGTSDFNTHMETCSPYERGLVIEPLKIYLDNLPDKDNVIKVNAALLFGEHKTVPIYYIKPEVIKKHGLFDWMRGCNSIGVPHDFHLNYFNTVKEFNVWDSYWKSPDAPRGRNLLDEGLVSVDEVPCVTFSSIINDYGIGSIKHIKFDTEGMDADLIHSMLDDLWTINEVRLPETILFETNAHNDTSKSFDVIQRLKNIGYDIYVGEANSNHWSAFTGTIYSDCKAVIKPRWKNEY
jgi:hypothetical protein